LRGSDGRRRSAPVKVHLINLDRHADRLREFASVNAHLPEVIRFPAIDGRSLDLSALVRGGIIKPGVLDTYTAARLGGALSHLALWDKAIETGEALTVCEDDAILHPDFTARAGRLLRQLPPDWDLILWGWNLQRGARFRVAARREPLPGAVRADEPAKCRFPVPAAADCAAAVPRAPGPRATLLFDFAEGCAGIAGVLCSNSADAASPAGRPPPAECRDRLHDGRSLSEHHGLCQLSAACDHE
jgi:hypothetical protein